MRVRHPSEQDLPDTCMSLKQFGSFLEAIIGTYPPSDKPAVQIAFAGRFKSEIIVNDVSEIDVSNDIIPDTISNPNISVTSPENRDLKIYLTQPAGSSGYLGYRLSVTSENAAWSAGVTSVVTRRLKEMPPWYRLARLSIALALVILLITIAVPFVTNQHFDLKRTVIEVALIGLAIWGVIVIARFSSLAIIVRAQRRRLLHSVGAVAVIVSSIVALINLVLRLLSAGSKPQH
jgi:hypothetical protein